MSIQYLSGVANDPCGSISVDSFLIIEGESTYRKNCYANKDDKTKGEGS